VADTIGNVALFAGLALAVLFLTHYLVVVRFKAARRSLTSWYLIGSNVLWVLILGLGAVTAVAGPSFPARSVIRAGVFTLIAAKLAAQYALLVDSTRRRHREEGNSR
jgi:hypothetical protein